MAPTGSESQMAHDWENYVADDYRDDPDDDFDQLD